MFTHTSTRWVYCKTRVHHVFSDFTTNGILASIKVTISMNGHVLLCNTMCAYIVCMHGGWLRDYFPVSPATKGAGIIP